VTVTVAIPVLNGARTLPAVLAAVAAQEVAADVEVLICDSSSGDESVAVARRHGADVLRIPRADFSHGATRNLLAGRAAGSHVAFLTQDAVPATTSWLAELLRGFELAPDVALTFGPYRAAADAPARVRRELDSWFGSFAPDGQPRIARLERGERQPRPRDLLGPKGFFTDANGCVVKAAWEQIPFRAVPYAEDHQLALDMLFAGYAKVYMPQAAVVHSHEYDLVTELRRAFDEWRALREVYGHVEPFGTAALRGAVVGATYADARLLRSEGAAATSLVAGVAASAAHHLARHTGAVLGSRADRFSPRVRRYLSLERRATFAPVDAMTGRS